MRGIMATLRTNDALVKEVLGDNYDSRSKLGQFILMANLLVSRVATCAAAKGLPLTTEELKVLETWVAASNYCASDAMYMQRSTSSASGSFQRTTGKGLDGNEYGQMALRLDTSGCLASMNSAQRAEIGWLGLRDSEQTDYRDRS